MPKVQVCPEHNDGIRACHTMRNFVFNRDETRLLILSRLYQKYYSGCTFTYLQTAAIFSDLLEQQPDALTGDLVYLEQKKMIEVLRGLNERLPNSVMITAHGIDRYETSMQKAYEKILNSKSSIPEDIESDLKARVWDKAVEWFENPPDFVRPFAKFFVDALQSSQM